MPKQCLHCDNKTGGPMCETCQKNGHQSPVGDCPLCPFQNFRTAKVTTPRKDKPLEGQQQLFN